MSSLKKSLSRPAWFAAAMVCFSLAITAGADIVVPVAWKQSNAFSDVRTATNLSNTLGMDDAGTILYNLDGSEPGEPNGANGVSFLTSSKADPNNLSGRNAALADGKIWIIADLGASYDLGIIRIWNWQWNLNGTTDLSNRGVKNFDIYVRNTEADTEDGMEDGTPINLTGVSDASGALTDAPVFDAGTTNPWTLALEDQSLAQAPNSDTYTAQSFDLTGQTARFVAIIAKTYYGGAGVGLGKVRIEGTPAAHTGLRLTITPAFPPATGFDLEWNSLPGKSYNLRTSSDLMGLIAGWEILEADIASNPPANLFNVATDGPRRFYAVEEFDTPPLLAENFEEIVGPETPTGWTRSDNGAGTVWEVGTPAGGADFVPNAAASGTQCAGTNINAQYTANADASLISPAFTVPESGATLSYWQYIDTEVSPSGDLGSIRLLNAADDTHLADVVTGIEGVTETWTKESVDLPAAANGLDVKLEFHFTSNEENNWGGFYIDDVLVTAK